MSKALFLVDVLISQIDSSGKTSMAVDYTDFPVIPVVHNHIQKWAKGIEDLALDPLRLEVSIILVGKCGQTAEVIVDQPNVHPLVGFLL